MADSIITPNNKAVAFGGPRKGKTMAKAPEQIAKEAIQPEIEEAPEAAPAPKPKAKKPPKDRADRLAGQGLVSDEQLAKAKKKLAPKIAPAPIAADEADGDPERD